ncbi:SH3 domain-containing protein [Pararhodobacter aggregans]
MSLIVIGLGALVLLALLKRSFRLMMGLGGGLVAAALGLQGGEDPATAPRRSPTAEARPWQNAPGTERLWVTTDRLHRRTCPSTDCGSLGWLALGEGVTVREIQNGWARISDPYDAACRGGASGMVETGNTACTPGNGIEGGRLAEWVSASFLSSTRPPDAPRR